uniref:Proprotein convertase subtilisin/kexin type 4 n=1 Tax=Athene cunicularia TaxID=194338 RepID=A0A663N1L5_ATHCN
FVPSVHPQQLSRSGSWLIVKKGAFGYSPLWFSIPSAGAQRGCVSLTAPRKVSYNSSLCLQVMEGEPYYHFKHRGTRQKALSRHWGWNMRLRKEPKVLWFEQQTVKRRTKRSVSVVPADPWFHKQWYMNNDINPDLNILTAWSKGYTGLGVVLTILDDGIEKDHPDLSANYDPPGKLRLQQQRPHPQPRHSTGDENRHGTRCAGEVAAAANNRICGAGVAYKAKVGGVRMLDGPITDVVEAQALSLWPQHIHIYSASWGPEDDGKTVDRPGVLATEAFYRGATKGRGGLGSIYIWASGNGGINHNNCNGYANSIYTLSVGSVLAGGQRPWYGEGCSAILTTTYSSGAETPPIPPQVTIDLHHRCTDKHTGTSASAPLAAGMVALALEANPALTWRDLQHLVLGSSRPAHLQAEDWAPNGAGRWGDHYYGYGLLVEMAKAWAGTRPPRRCSVKALHTPRTIGSQLTVSTNVSSCSRRTRRIRALEHVQVQLSLSYSHRGDLEMALTSPMGTTSTLVSVRPYDTSQEGYKDWTFMSTHFWDENPEGTWTLQLQNKGDAGNTGLLSSLTLHLHGTEGPMADRRSAASAPDGCLRRDARGACEACSSSLYTHRGSCLAVCPPRHYGHLQRTAASVTRICASCHPSCYTCQGASANNCTACAPTSDTLTRSCSPPLASRTQEGLHRRLLPILLGGSLSATLCHALPGLLRVTRSICCPRAGRTA